MRDPEEEFNDSRGWLSVDAIKMDLEINKDKTKREIYEYGIIVGSFIERLYLADEGLMDSFCMTIPSQYKKIFIDKAEEFEFQVHDYKQLNDDWIIIEVTNNILEEGGLY